MASFMGSGLQELACYLVLGTQAAGADFNPCGLALNGQGSLLYIGKPAPIGVALGMTHIMSKLGSFTTDLALGQLVPL